MAFVVVATWKARPENVQRIKDILEELAPLSRSEPGCLEYQVQQAVDDPTSFLLYEQYRDAEAFDAHRASAHFQRLAGTELQQYLAERGRTFYHTLFDA